MNADSLKARPDAPAIQDCYIRLVWGAGLRTGGQGRGIVATMGVLRLAALAQDDNVSAVGDSSRAQHAAQRFQFRDDLLRPLRHFVVAQRALLRLELRVEEHRVLAGANLLAAKDLCRNELL